MHFKKISARISAGKLLKEEIRARRVDTRAASLALLTPRPATWVNAIRYSESRFCRFCSALAINVRIIAWEASGRVSFDCQDLNSLSDGGDLDNIF